MVRYSMCAYYEECLFSLHPDFFPFGVDNNDSIGPRAIDEVTEPITLQVPMVFYLRKEKTIYVS